MKRAFDVVIAAVALLACSVVLLPLMLGVWLHDGHSPLYFAPRVGRLGRTFRMLKLRSMIPDADATGVDSTSAGDWRVTPIGGFMRRLKLDEIPQLLNVLWGDMSIVGPRPNVRRETDLYTAIESRLLGVRPGITDFASIVYSDLGEILRDRPDPDIAYNQLVRPGKSLLGIFYVDHMSFRTDLHICWLTVVSFLSRPLALEGLQRLLRRLDAPQELLRIASRSEALVPMSPPGAELIVTARQTAKLVKSSEHSVSAP